MDARRRVADGLLSSGSNSYTVVSRGRAAAMAAAQREKIRAIRPQTFDFYKSGRAPESVLTPASKTKSPREIIFLMVARAGLYGKRLNR